MSQAQIDSEIDTKYYAYDRTPQQATLIACAWVYLNSKLEWESAVVSWFGGLTLTATDGTTLHFANARCGKEANDYTDAAVDILEMNDFGSKEELQRKVVHPGHSVRFERPLISSHE